MKISKYPFLILFVVFVFYFFTYHFDLLHKYPEDLHVWSQFDRIALIHGFFNNNFNFFKPETYALYKPFCDNCPNKFGTTITSVDFPIHEYITSLLMYIINTKSIIVFRLYNISLTFIGLFFLYKSVRQNCKSIHRSLFVLFFTIFTPVFCFYNPGCIPSTLSIATFFIAFYYLTNYLNHKNIKHFILSCLFLTLSSLVRTPFFIYLIALTILPLFEYLTTRKIPFKQIGALIFSICIVAAYFLYNNYLRNIHGSIFLGHPLPVENLPQFVELLKSIIQNWISAYFQYSQWLLIFSIPIYFFFRKELLRANLPLLLYIFIAFVGSYLYFILMMKQFVDHDYYFLDTFFCPTIMLLWYVTVYHPPFKNLFKLPLLKWGVTIFIFILLNTTNYATCKKRRNLSWNDWPRMIAGYEGKAELLKKWGVKDNDVLFVIAANATNTPLVLLDHKGYCLEPLSPSEEHFEFYKNFGFDYIVVLNNYYSAIDNTIPDLKNHLELKGTDGTLSLFTYHEAPTQKTIDELFLNTNIHALVNSWKYQKTDNVISKEELFYNFCKIQHPSRGRHSYILDIEQIQINNLNQPTRINITMHTDNKEYTHSIKVDRENMLNKHLFTIDYEFNDIEVYHFNENHQNIEIQSLEVKLYQVN